MIWCNTSVDNFEKLSTLLSIIRTVHFRTLAVQFRTTIPSLNKHPQGHTTENQLITNNGIQLAGIVYIKRPLWYNYVPNVPMCFAT